MIIYTFPEPVTLKVGFQNLDSWEFLWIFFKEFMRLKLFHDKTKMLFVFLTMSTSVFIILRLIYLVEGERDCACE